MRGRDFCPPLFFLPRFFFSRSVPCFLFSIPCVDTQKRKLQDPVNDVDQRLARLDVRLCVDDRRGLPSVPGAAARKRRALDEHWRPLLGALHLPTCCSQQQLARPEGSRAVHGRDDVPPRRGRAQGRPAGLEARRGQERHLRRGVLQRRAELRVRRGQGFGQRGEAQGLEREVQGLTAFALPAGDLFRSCSFSKRAERK